MSGAATAKVGDIRHADLYWCMVLIFMPFIGIVLYIIFGMDNRHRRLIGTEEYDRLVTDIENARHHINILFFKFEDDAAGRRVADALIRKAGEGVQVRLIYDEAGNMMVSRRFYKRLREHGVQVRGFIRIFLPVLSRDYNSRNHRKVVVIDGKVGYMGGMNVAQRYAEGLKWGIWHFTVIIFGAIL